MLCGEFRFFRKIMCWFFAFVAVVCLWIVLIHISNTIRYYHSLHHPLLGMIVPTVFLLLATIFGMAWWTVWKDKTSAKIWGITACLINILVTLMTYIRHSRSLSSRQWELFAVGIVGLIAFLWPDKEESEMDLSETYEIKPDDTEHFSSHS